MFAGFNVNAQAFCGEVRIGELPVGHALASNAIAKVYLNAVGYEVNFVHKKTESELLEGIKNAEIDVYFNLSLPIADDEVRRYAHMGDIRTVSQNLSTYRIGLAVNEAGKKSIADISQLTSDLTSTNPNIHVSETDSGAILKLRSMISRNQFGTGIFRLKVLPPAVFKQAILNKKDHNQIHFFLVRQPSIVSRGLAMLSDTEHVLGGNNGHNAQYTIIRKNYQRQCKNIARLIKNIRFSLTTIKEVELRLIKKVDVTEYIKKQISENLKSTKTIFHGIKTYTGLQGFDHVQRYLSQ